MFSVCMAFKFGCYVMISKALVRSSGIYRCINKQRGAAMIEFSVVLLPLLTLFYGIIVYSLVFVTQQAVAFAAESGADAVVAVDPMTATCDPADATINAVVTNRVTNLVRFLPGGVGAPQLSVPATPSGTGCQLLVTVTYPFSNWGFAITGLLPLPGVITGQGLVNTQLP